ncbi:MAG: F0F1 ATP synthase subunit delta [Janthinobacterium lividum]
MLIDWFTVIAQAVNFLVLVWLLKRFLYQPILSAIDARETGIAAKFAAAEAKTKEAQAASEDFQHKTEAFEQQRGVLLTKAAEDAGAERERLLAAARKDADAVRLEWQTALKNEQKDFGEEIVRRTRLGVFDIARKTLTELAGSDLEECMSRVFIARLRGLSVAEHDQFAASLTSPALVRSTFELSEAERGTIEAAVQETFASQAPLRFETAPNLVSGIEITANGQKIAWSIADYLGALEKSMGELLESKTEPAVAAVSG